MSANRSGTPGDPDGTPGEQGGKPGGSGPGGPSRRGLLKAGLAAGAVAGAGAGSWTPASAASRPGKYRPLRKPGSLPYPKLPMGTDTIPQIQHIVILMMENHSYDNRLGMLRRRGADGFRRGRDGLPLATNPYANGYIQHAFRMPTTCQLTGKPTQEWEQSHIQFNDGRNNGFVESLSGPVSMGYWERADQPFYYSMASVFPISDRYFCSVLGQTYPNRRYLISATSLGMVDDTIPSLVYPKNGTIFDKVHDAGLSWRDYYTTSATTELYPELYIKNLGTNVVPITDFFKDAAAGTLPALALVEPNYGTQSEEDPQNIVVGEVFAASVIHAVMNGPGWERTLLIWNYDEHGGYFDHVPPPPALAPDDIPPDVPTGEPVYNGFRQYGFRVPMAVISPYSRPCYVSHVVNDHTSICALVEHKWNLPAMTYRDANAGNLLDMVDLRCPAFRHPPKLAKPLLETDPSSMKCSTTGPGTIPPPGSVTPPPH
jgi:phospholipase C